MITICKRENLSKLQNRHSPLRLFAVAAPNGNPQPVAQKIIHILSTGRRFVLHPVALWHDSHDRLGSQLASGVIVQMKIDGFHMGVVLQKSGEGHRQLAFLDLFLWLVHPGQGQQIVPPPVDPVLGLFLLRRWHKGRRRDGRPAGDGFHGLQKGIAVDLDEIVQRTVTADPTGKPAPFAVGNPQAVTCLPVKCLAFL